MKLLKTKLLPDRRVFTDSQLQEALRPVLIRLLCKHYLVAFIRAIVAAMAASLLLLIFAYIRPWADVLDYCLAAAGVISLLAAILAVISRPGLWEAACQADANGLKERVSTALELSFYSSGNELHARQREDALQHLQGLNLRDCFPLHLPRQECRAFLALALFLVLINIIPNPQQAEVDRQIAVRKEIAKQTEQVQKVKNELEKKNEKAPSARREEGIKALDELQQQLNGAKKQEQAMKALANTEDKLKKLSLEEDSNNDLQRLSQGLKQAKISKEMGEKLAGGDSREIKQSFNQLAERMPSLTASDRQNLSASLNQAAASTNDEGLRNQLNQVAESLNSGSARAAGSKLSALGAALGHMSQQSAVNADLAMAQASLQSARTGIAAASSGSGASMASAGTNCQHPECNAPGGNG